MASQESSIGTLLEGRKGIGPGFDVLRVGLAFSVVGCILSTLRTVSLIRSSICLSSGLPDTQYSPCSSR